MNAKPTAYPILGHNYSNGDARNRTEKFENTLERKSLYACHRQNEAETSENIINIKECPNDLSLDNTILPCKTSHFLAIYLQISPKILR